MKALPWGEYYNEYKEFGNQLCADETEAIVARLMQDEDVTKKSGIYRYILSGNEKYLNIRAFTPNRKREAYERQDGVCPVCGKEFEFDEMEGDHIAPWHRGGKTIPENCQMPGLTHESQPCLIWFLFVGPTVCLGLVSDSTSRWTPLPLAMRLVLPPALGTLTR